MTDTNHTQRDVNLLIGTGGSRAILFGTGVVLALSQANFRKFRSIGGVSGGSMPASLIATNPDASALLKEVLKTDFDKLVTRRVSLLQFLAQVIRDRKPIDPPERVGALDATLMGQYFDTNVPDWPKLFWTMALSHQKQVVLTRDGVMYEQDGGVLTTISKQALSVSAAIRATCAVPFLLDPVPWIDDGGEEHLLIDGGYSPEGRCPMSVPERLFALDDSCLVVVNVGEDRSHLHRMLDKVFDTQWKDEKVVTAELPDPAPANYERIVVRPALPISGSFKFKLSQREKWQMILSGYMSAVEAFEKHGLLSDCALHRARERGLQALLLLAGRQRPYLKDALPSQLDTVFAGLSFAPEQFEIE